MKTAARFVAIGLLLLTGVLGVWNGINDLAQSASALSRSVNVAVLIYGPLGLLGGVGLIRRRPWTVPVTIGWTIASMYAGTVASFAFHDPTLSQSGTITGTLAAFVSIALICGFVVWIARSTTRVPSSDGTGHIPTP